MRTWSTIEEMFRARGHSWAKVALALSLGFGADPGSMATAAPSAPSTCGSAVCGAELVYVGTHQKAGDPSLFAARFDPRTGRFTALGAVSRIEQPTWLATDPHRAVLYAVSELGGDAGSEAKASSLAVDRKTGQVQLTSTVGSKGAGAAYLALDQASRTAFVANYRTGQVAALPIHSDGALGEAASVRADYGSGPTPRQSGPHAHGIAVAPDGRYVLVADLGADRVFIYRFDAVTRNLTPGEPAYEPVAPGSGPRHLVFSRNGRFVFLVSELSAEVRSYSFDPLRGRLHLLQTVSTVASGYSGETRAAEIRLSVDGRYIYTSNRGEDSIVVYAVDPTTGRLSEVQRIGANGRTPWSLAFDLTGKWLLAANEGSDGVAVFQVDRRTGKLTAGGDLFAVPKPVAIAVFRER